MPKITNIVFLTCTGESVGLAIKAKREGLDVVWATVENYGDMRTSVEAEGKPEDPEEKRRRLSLLDGFGIKKTSAADAVARWKRMAKKNRASTFVFTDMSHCWKYAQELRGLGFPGIFPTEEERILEVSRDKMKEIVEKEYPALTVGEEHRFDTVEDGIEFLEDTEDVWCLKGFDEDCTTHVPRTPDAEVAKKQVVKQLRKENNLYEKSGYILEKKILDAIEITPQVCFVAGKPVYASVDIELKPTFDGNLGRLCGCSADLVFPVPLDSEIVKMITPPWVHDRAKKNRGIFFWDASILFDPKDGTPYFGEVCANRPGWNSFYDEVAMAPSFTSYIQALADGEDPYAGTHHPFASSIRLFNFSKDKKTGKDGAEGETLYFDPDWQDGHLWQMDVRMEKGEVVSCGYGKDLAVLTGMGEYPEDAIDDIFGTLDDITFDGLVHRTKGDLLNPGYQSGLLERYGYAVSRGLFRSEKNLAAERTNMAIARNQ